MQPLLQWKAISITYSEHVSVALVIQHEMHISHIIICGLPGSAIFSTLSHKQQNFRGGLLNTKCVSIFSTTVVKTFLILRRNKRDIKKVHWSSCKVPFSLVWFSWKLNFLNRFFKNPQISNFMKIRPVGAELFHTYGWMDGWTDRHDEANNHFSQFCEQT